MFSDTHPKPICLNIWKTFEAEPPARRIAIQSKKFPAGILEFGITGWLYHVNFFWGHLGLVHMLFTTISVPTWRVCSNGPSALHEWQNLNNINNWPINTINFGSVQRLLPHSKLKHKKYVYCINQKVENEYK